MIKRTSNDSFLQSTVQAEYSYLATITSGDFQNDIFYTLQKLHRVPRCKCSAAEDLKYGKTRIRLVYQHEKCAPTLVMDCKSLRFSH